MTAFIKANFTGTERHHEYLHYPVDGTMRFVMRSKHGRGGKADFIKFLIANFTVEEYFEQMDAGVAPQKILETKGFLSATVKRIITAAGYEGTTAGFDQYIADGLRRRARAIA